MTPADRNLLAWLHALEHQAQHPTHVFDMEEWLRIDWLDKVAAAEEGICGTVAGSAGTAILANVGGILDQFPLPRDIILCTADPRLKARQ